MKPSAHVTAICPQRAKNFAFLIAMLAATTPVMAKEKFAEASEVVAAVMPSFVNITDRKLEPGKNSGDAPVIRDEVGSGFIIDSSGLILTNRHVIENAYAIYVTLNDGRRLRAKLVGKTLNFDLAVLKVEAGRPLQPVVLGDSDKMRLGQKVVAIGNPLGFTSSVSAGVVSAFGRSIGLSAYDDVIQTDATINQGNSGGPLFNMSGEVIGVNQAIYRQNQGGSIGIGFSIPINSVKFVLEEVRNKKKAGYLGVGIQSVMPAMADALKMDEVFGAIVARVVKDSPAEKTGIQVGDVILTVGGEKVKGADAVNRAVAVALGKKVQIGLLRNGQRLNVIADIVESPNALWTDKTVDAPKIEKFEDLGLVLGSPAPNGKPMVASVVESSLAASAGFRAGDVIERVGNDEITSQDMLLQHFQQHKANGLPAILVLVSNNGQERWIGASIVD